MLKYQIWTAKVYTKEEYNLIIDFFNENYYHILEELVEMAESNSGRQELQKQIALLDTFQDIQNQLECYRDSTLPFEGDENENN